MQSSNNKLKAKFPAENAGKMLSKISKFRFFQVKFQINSSFLSKKSSA